MFLRNELGDLQVVLTVKPQFLLSPTDLAFYELVAECHRKQEERNYAERKESKFNISMQISADQLQ